MFGYYHTKFHNSGCSQNGYLKVKKGDGFQPDQSLNSQLEKSLNTFYGPFALNVHNLESDFYSTSKLISSYKIVTKFLKKKRFRKKNPFIFQMP